MRSRLFHAVVLGGMGLRALACTTSDEPTPVATTPPAAGDAEVRGPDADVGLAADAGVDAARIVDATDEDRGWHPTK